MLIVEYRVILPVTVEEYQVAQLWSVAQASKNETGGGEGIEVLKNEPFDVDNKDILPELKPTPLLLGGNPLYSKGQYTHKKYYLQSKVPSFVRLLAPKGSLEIDEWAWNAYPYCRTIVDNPSYMKENFYIKIETMHVQTDVNIENVHQLSPELLAKRKVVYIDIANDKLYSQNDYKKETDPKLFQSQKTKRGALTAPEWWKNTDMPIMCAYKLVTCEFKWWGLQTRVESFIQAQERRIFTNFHRQLFCWMDNWHGLTMADIRRIEEETRKDLDEQRNKGTVRGTTAAE